jgi:hypothetical protein
MKTGFVDGDSTLLTCWKDIAKYLGKSVRTVQRWEENFGLPVLRPNGTRRKSAVVAQIRDLDAWLAGQWSGRTNGKKQDGKPAERIVGINDLIKRSQELRSAHVALMEETSVALEILVESFNQLDGMRRNKLPPPRFLHRNFIKRQKPLILKTRPGRRCMNPAADLPTD